MTQTDPPDNRETPAKRPAKRPGNQGRRLVGYIVIGALLIGSAWVVDRVIRPRYEQVPQAVPWRGQFATAQAEAKAKGVPMLVEFTADWCPPCQVMAKEVYARDEVGAAMDRGFVPVQIDMTHADAPGSDVAEQYNVYGLPTLLALEPDGQVLMRVPGMIDAQRLMTLLDQLRGPIPPPAIAAPDASETAMGVDQKAQSVSPSANPAG